MNNTGTKYVRIMKQTEFWREKNGEYIPCLKYSVLIYVLVYEVFGCLGWEAGNAVRMCATVEVRWGTVTVCKELV